MVLENRALSSASHFVGKAAPFRPEIAALSSIKCNEVVDELGGIRHGAPPVVLCIFMVVGFMVVGAATGAGFPGFR
jgi:hypothetical protein